MTDSSDPRTSDLDCLRCHAAIESLGVEQFRVGGSSGGWKLVFGEFAELGEGMLSFEVLACSTCGHVELRMPKDN